MMSYDFLNNKIELGDTVIFPHKQKDNAFDMGIVEKVNYDWVWLVNKGKKRTDKCIVVKKVMQETRT